MFKLLIVFLFFLKIKSESENSFMKNLLSEEKNTLGSNQNNKAYGSVNIKERLFFDDQVTKSNPGMSIGKVGELNHKTVEGNKNKEFSLFHENENEFVKKDDKKISDQIEREKLLQINGIKNLNSGEDTGKNSHLYDKFNDLRIADESLLLKLMQPTKALKTSNSNKNNKLFGNGVKDQKEYSQLDSEYRSGITTAGNEAPFNFLKSKLEEGIDEEDSNKNYDNYDISKYKSDSRNGCIPNVSNKESTKNGGPQILFDREQDDGPHVSLMCTLINLKTLRPKTRVLFTDNGIIKKCTTQDQCKSLTKASAIKPITNQGATPNMRNNAVTSHGKNKNNMTKTDSNKTGHTMSSKRKTTCVSIKDLKSQKPLTPLFTIQPWPELTLTRNSCLSTKFSPKTHLTSPLTGPSPLPSTPGNRPPESTHTLPSMTQNATQRDIRTENTFQAVPSQQKLSSFDNTDQLVNTTTSSEISSSNSLPTLPLVSTEVEGGVNTYSTQEAKVTSGVADIDQTKLSVNPSSLLTDPSKPSTKSNMTSCKRIGTSETSSSPLPEIITSSQVQPTNTETILNNSTNSIETTQSTQFSETPQKDENNTEIRNSLTTAYTNRLLTSSPVPDSVSYTGLGMENTPLLSSNPSGMSYGTISGNMTGQSVTDQIQNRNNNTTGVKSEVPETTLSLYSQGKSSIGVENISTTKKTGQDEWIDSYLQPTVTEGKTTPKETLSSDEIMSFSPPPPVVFSHEPQFIATLFNDAMGGKTECVDLPRNKGSYTIDHLEQSEPEPSQLKDLFASPEASTLAVTKPAQGHSQSLTVSQGISPVAVVTEPNQSILIGHLKSFTSSNPVDTYSKGPIKAYFHESKDLKAVSNCLEDFSRIFSSLETKKCE